MTTFSTSREIPVSPDLIFAAIREPERLARWWGPAGFSNSFQVFEFKPGGKWSFTMHAPNGANYPNESEFIEIIPNALVRIRHVSAPQFTLSIGLSAKGAHTVVTWSQGFDDSEVANSIRHIVEPANEQNLDRLTAEAVPQ